MNEIVPQETKGSILLKEYDSQKSELPKYWEKDFINSKIASIDNVMHKTFFRTLWMSGVRVTEGINIRKCDIDFQNYVVTIKWLKNRKYYSRTIPLHPILKNVLEIFVAPLKSGDRLFPFTRQRADQLIKKYFGEDAFCHRLRHSFAVNWLRAGGDIFVLSRMLGHSDIKVTMVYLQIVPIDVGKELLKVPFD